VFGLIGSVVSVVLIICFIYLYLSKNGRDERGREIFAFASFISLILFLVLTHLFGIFIASFFPATISIFAIAHLLQLLLNIVLLVHIISTFILHKTK